MIIRNIPVRVIPMFCFVCFIAAFLVLFLFLITLPEQIKGLFNKDQKPVIV